VAFARRRLILQPELWLYVVAAGAGLALVVHGEHHHRTWLPGWLGWTAMAVAMMLPVVAPEARRMAMRSLWGRRHRAIAWFLAGYVAVWSAVSAVLVAALVAVGQPHPGPAVLAAALLVAAGWQVAGPRRRAMRRCGLLGACAARGWRADRDCAAVGVRIGMRSTFTCGPVMVAMGLGHQIALMAGLLVLLLSERARGPNPQRRAGRPLEAWCLAGFAAVAGFAAIP
jgi:predicted metal-binding membrane protein